MLRKFELIGASLLALAKSIYYWKLAEIFFAKDRMAPEANRFNSFLRILENAISSGKKQTNKQTKQPQELV